MTNTISFFDPTGTEVVLPAISGIKSRMMPQIVSTQVAVPFQPGARAMAYRHDVRKVDVPIVLHNDAETLRDQYRYWAHIFDPTRGDGVLRVTRGIDGSYRDLTCRYAGGWDFQEDYEFFSQPSLSFVAIDDPYWHTPETAPVQFTAASTTGVTKWFPFSFPFTFGASEVFATQGLVNPGDVAAWPVWTVYGPGTALTITNNDTGQVLAMTGIGSTLGVHDFLVADTRPRVKTLTRSDGLSMFSSLTLDSEMFSIAPGGVSVSVEMGGATTTSLVSVSYRVGYLAA